MRGRCFVFDALDLLRRRSATGEAHDREHELVDCRLHREHEARGRRRRLAIRRRTQPAVPRAHVPRRRYPDRRADLRPQRVPRDVRHTGRRGVRGRGHASKAAASIPTSSSRRSAPGRARGPRMPRNTGLWSVDTRVRRPEDARVTFNLADMFERVVDAVPDREVLVTPTRRLTFRELDARANQLAHHLADAGIGAGDHVGLQLMNGSEYLEAMLAAFKLRAVPVNINYRFVETELAYLYENADLVALLYDDELREAGRRRARRRADAPPSDLRRRRRRSRHPRARSTTRPRSTRARRRATSGPARATICTSRTRAAPPASRRGWCGATRTSSSPRWAEVIRRRSWARSPNRTRSSSVCCRSRS